MRFSSPLPLGISSWFINCVISLFYFLCISWFLQSSFYFGLVLSSSLGSFCPVKFDRIWHIYWKSYSISWVMFLPVVVPHLSFACKIFKFLLCFSMFLQLSLFYLTHTLHCIFALIRKKWINLVLFLPLGGLICLSFPPTHWGWLSASVTYS